MSDFIEEIKQEVAHERWVALWKRYQNHILGVIAGLLLITAALSWWQNHQKAIIRNQSDFYIQAVVLSETDPKSSLKLFERIPVSGETVYATLSRFWVASLLLDQNNKEDAIAIYKTIEEKNGSLLASKQEKVFAHTARMRRALLLVDTQPQDVLALMKPFLSHKNTWGFIASEISALAHIKLDQPEKAKPFLTEIMSASDATPQMKIRAQSLLNSLNN